MAFNAPRGLKISSGLSSDSNVDTLRDFWSADPEFSIWMCVAGFVSPHGGERFDAYDGECMWMAIVEAEDSWMLNDVLGSSEPSRSTIQGMGRGSFPSLGHRRHKRPSTAIAMIQWLVTIVHKLIMVNKYNQLFVWYPYNQLFVWFPLH